MRHLQNMAKVMLATGLIVGYGYGIEAFMGLVQRQHLRALQPGQPHVRTLCGLLLGADHLQRGHPAIAVVQAGSQQSAVGCFSSPLVVLVRHVAGALVIVVTSLHRDYLPSSWGMYSPTVWDWTMFLGTIGFFFALMFLFVRFLPMISIAEMQTLLPAVARAARRAGRPQETLMAAVSGLYGLLAEFETPTALVAGRPHRPTRPATREWTLIRRSPSRSCRTRWAFDGRRCRS